MIADSVSLLKALSSPPKSPPRAIPAGSKARAANVEIRGTEFTHPTDDETAAGERRDGGIELIVVSRGVDEELGAAVTCR